MPIHGRIAGIAGPFIRSQLRGAAGYTYRALKVQDRIIDKTYRKAGLYNRGLVKGIQHGLISGQVIGGVLGLGFDENGVPEQTQTYKQRKTYRGRKRTNYRFNKYSPCKPNRRRRYVSTFRPKWMSYR